MSAMVYWSAASHSWFFRWSSSTCSQLALQSFIPKKCVSGPEIRWDAEDLLGANVQPSLSFAFSYPDYKRPYSQQESMFHTGCHTAISTVR